MNIKGTVLAVKGNLAKIQLENEKLKVNMPIVVTVGKTRSQKANRFYWVYLTYLIENHLKEQGFFCPESIHCSLKAHFLSSKEYDRGKFKVFFTGSTTELSRKDFIEYIDKIDMFVCDFFGINTQPFWVEYAQMMGE